MPAKSKAQFKKMFVLYRQGKINKKQLHDFTAEESVNYQRLPARKRKASPKKKGRGK
jgi:hypothetical protein